LTLTILHMWARTGFDILREYRVSYAVVLEAT
jgi:hypothetical protein